MQEKKEGKMYKKYVMLRDSKNLTDYRVSKDAEKIRVANHRIDDLERKVD